MVRFLSLRNPFFAGMMGKCLVRISDQSIIDRQDILMQILLDTSLKIVLFTSKHTITNVISVRGGVSKTTVLRYLFTG